MIPHISRPIPDPIQPRWEGSSLSGYRRWCLVWEDIPPQINMIVVGRRVSENDWDQLRHEILLVHDSH
jgi:hypothetical protein